MKKITNVMKRVCAIALVLVLTLGNLSGITLPVSAQTVVFGGLGSKTADPATVNGWKEFYGGMDTSYAGGAWSDKSVFESASAYFAATDEEEDAHAVEQIKLEDSRDFLIALSAIASTKTIVGYSTLPTDTMFVLDVSGSMDDNSNRDARMVEAANKAIGDLLALNNYNRVGVVLYSGTNSDSGATATTLLLPLDRYSTTSTTTLNNETIPSYIYLSSNDYVNISNGVRNSDKNRPSGNRSVVGATYIQKGIYVAMRELTDPNLDTVITEGFQVGTTRTPIMVLMSDGAPTLATDSYTNIGNRNMGNGQSSSTTHEMSFVTQLTASWAKEKIGEKYGDEVEPLFYTLGLGVGNDSRALGIMDPLNANASSTAKAYWSEFLAANEGDEIDLDNHYNREVTKLNDGVNDGVDNLPLSQNYVDRYFPAGTSNELSQAFQSIVDTIVLQTMYYPTLVEDDVHHSGYMEFRDYIGPNMEVKEVEGVQLGSSLYTGERFAELVATGMGTVQNPTEAGNELVWSVMTRLQIGEIGDEAATQTVRDLLTKAWTAGQLAYHVDYDGNVTWSNWIGWYADENDKYLGFWDGDGIDPDMVGKAAYAIKSYLVLGDVGEGHRDTDMLYASVQVRSALDQNGNVTEDIVYGRLPASLIPLVEYNVALDSNDPATAKEITLTKTGATAPARLIYEVGLRDRIDILNMEGTAVEDLKTDEDGNFIFYTNQWDTAGLEEGNHPNKLHNTYVNFFPSEENERYHYHEDMPIYVMGNNGYVRYSGSKPTAGDGRTYYRAYVVYTAQTNGGEASYTVNYQPIPASALTDENVQPISGSNNWVVKKGVVYLYQARNPVSKTENRTATLPYSEYAIVHSDAAEGYHIDAILGNNGVLTVDPPEGLKLTKQIDETLVDEGQTYAFTIELTNGSHENAHVYLFVEEDGQRSASEEIEFVNGAYDLELGVGDSAWLIGLPEGNEYTITEQIDGEYEVSLITIDGDEAEDAAITVEENHIADIEFTNAAVFTGDVVISKNVVSSYDPHETDAYKFVFDGTLTGADADTIYETVHVTADGTEIAGDPVTTDANGEAVFTVELSHGENLTIVDLPEGASVEVTEDPLPGFTSNQTNDTASADVVAGETVAIGYVNTYEPEAVSPYGIVDVYAEKILEGRNWAEGDSFTFVLEKHVTRDQHEVIEEVTVDYDDVEKIADFQSNVNDLYDAVGTYSYRIMETTGNLAGVAYDTAICYFDIVVEDDGEGHLYIADVIGRQDVTVDHDDQNNTWDVTAQFTNVYNSEGTIQISLSVAKDVEDPANTGISKAGFEFELYDADEDFNIGNTPRATVTTNNEGVAAFHDTLFSEEGTFYFVLKEAEGSVPGMEYDTAVYYGTVEITSDPETSGLVATGTLIDDEGNEVYSETVEYDPGTAVIPTMSYAAEFTNTYVPTDVEASITGTKTITGREINDGEFVFELYEAELTDEGFITGDYITEVENDGDGFTFEAIDELTFTETGYYYYAVKEEAGDLGGVTYDDATFYVTIRVVADLEDGALVVNAVNVTDAAGVSTALHFRNTYSAAAVDAVISGTKELTGTRKLAANMFQFYLYETGSDYSVSGEPVQTVTNDAEGEVVFELNYTAPGEYYYVVSERTPAGLAADERLNGVDYDETTYRVLVTVTDDLRGNLIADVSYLDGAAEFVNDYTPAPTEDVVLGGSKVLSGRNQVAGEFTFALYETDAKFVPVDNVAEATAVNVPAAGTGYTFTFDALNFDRAGGYRYIIVEQRGSDSQIAYDPIVYYVLINVSDNGNGQLIAQVDLGNAIDANAAITSPVTAMEFFNVFTHTPAELTLEGTKVLLGHDWSHDEMEHTFSFELYDANEEFVVADGAQPVVVSNDPAKAGQEGKFTFPEMTFEEEGTYYYVVREKLPAGVNAQSPRDESTGIIYDMTEHHVTVTVAEDPADPSALKADYVVDGSASGITFTNQYTAEGEVFATISGKKILEGRNLHTDGFSFVLKDSTGKEIETVINHGDGTTNEGTFSFHALTFNAAGTYTYTVEEIKGNVPGVTYSNEVYTVVIEVGHKDGKLLEPVVTYQKNGAAVNEISFTNTYKAAASEPLVLEGTKALVGGILKDGAFTFELYQAEKNAEGSFVKGVKLDDATNENGKFAFEGQTYDQVGEYYYIVSEQAGSETGVTYDDNVFYVTVVVEDPGDGRLVAKVDQIDRDEHTVGVGINFTNTFTPAPIDVSFSGTKSLSGRTMEAGEFTFELYEVGADHTVAEGTTALMTAVNAADGSFVFDPVELESVGSYYFVIKEQKGTAAHVTYDVTTYNVTINVSNHDGVLEKEVIYKVGSETKDAVTFQNSYKKPDPQPNPITVELNVEKIMKGNYRYGAENFKFELVDEEGNVVDTARSDEDGEAVLTAGTFKKADAGKTYVYYLYEVDTDISGMIYSTREYEVEISIYYDSASNKLSYELVKDGDVVDEDEPFVFTNIYNPGGPKDPEPPYDPFEPYEPIKPTSPDTGDTGIGGWITLLVIGCLGFVMTVCVMVFKKRRA